MSTSSLSIAVSALKAHSYAIDTTAHNIANASTEGYRRERVDLKPAYPRHTALGMMGAGVDAVGVSRATDKLADERVRRAGAQLQAVSSRQQVAVLAEDVFGEPDRGLTTSLASAFDSFATLAAAPTDSAARAQVIASLNDVAGRVNELRTGLEGMELDARARLEVEIDSANQIAERIAEINVYAQQPGGLPADLADELDLALDELANRLGATSQTQPDGRVRVTINGRALVDADRAIPLAVPDNPVGQVDHPTGPIVLGGTAGGLQTAIQTDLGGYRTRLDDYVSSMISQLNDVHAGGYTTDGTPGGELFTEVDGRVIVQITDGAELAASDDPIGPLGGAVADQLAQLRTSVSGAYREVITHVSNSVASLTRSVDTAAAISEGALGARDSVVGVNMDEELTNMISQQRAYEAAARVITIVDEMMQTLLGM